MSGRAWIDCLVSTPPSSPHRHTVEAQRGALFTLAVDSYAEARLDWNRARAVFSATQRRARSFSSSKRRFLMDALTFLVRQEATLSRLLLEAGLSEGSSRRRVEESRYLAALIVFGGLKPQDVEWDGPPLDWDAVSDPRHTLESWFRRESPSQREQLATFGSIPEWLAQRFLDADDPAALVAALNRRGALCLRANRPFATREQLLIEVEGATPCRLASEGIRLPSHADARALSAFSEGRVDIQDEGSQLIVELASPAAGERVIDACAGALGKSLAIASAQEDSGRIVATDLRKDALKRGLKRAHRAGYQSIRTVAPDRVRGPADLVLVDAPCSGTGAIRRRPWSRWSVHLPDVLRLQQEQVAILTQAASWVGKEGRLVYATCSLLREENDRVVELFLKQNPTWRLKPAAEVVGQERAEEIGDSGVLRLYPHLHDTDGFFAAVLTRS